METLNVGTLSTELSIIVPVYNGGKYLGPCLDSIVAQAYSNWELLLIDDGSSDGSAAVCDEYASRDSRITVVHKPNGGQAAARNDGVALAKGRYVCFVDCDDWLEPAMYATMIQTLEQQQADIIICGYIEEYATRKKYIKLRLEEYHGHRHTAAADRFGQCNHIRNYACTLEGEEITRSAAAYLDIVTDKIYSMLCAKLSETSEPFHRSNNYTALSLNCLNNNGSRLFYTRMVAVKYVLHICNSIKCFAYTKGIGHECDIRKALTCTVSVIFRACKSKTSC